MVSLSTVGCLKMPSSRNVTFGLFPVPLCGLASMLRLEGMNHMLSVGQMSWFELCLPHLTSI